MEPVERAGTARVDMKVHVRLKLSALWASVMFCYIYADYFGLYVPGKLQGMLEGKIAPLGATTQGVLVGTSIMLAVPAVMVFLSLALKVNLSRWLNFVLGSLYTVIILITMPGAWAFYKFYGAVEITLTALIVWYAWSWPKREAA